MPHNVVERSNTASATEANIHLLFFTKKSRLKNLLNISFFLLYYAQNERLKTCAWVLGKRVKIHMKSIENSQNQSIFDRFCLLHHHFLHIAHFQYNIDCGLRIRIEQKKKSQIKLLNVFKRILIRCFFLSSSSLLFEVSYKN